MVNTLRTTRSRRRRGAMARSATRSLFGDPDPEPLPNPEPAADAPLAGRMRPRALDEYVGQGHLLGQGRLVPPIIPWTSAFGGSRMLLQGARAKLPTARSTLIRVFSNGGCGCTRWH